MRFTDVFSAQSIAFRRTVDASNAVPFLGTTWFPNKRKNGITLKWIKGHKGVGVALKPSSFDALATIRPRAGVTTLEQEMPLFRESMTVKEHDLMELERIKDSNDSYLDDVIEHVYNDTGELIDGAEISAERMRMQLLAPASGEMQISVGLADNTAYIYDYDSDDSWKGTHYASLSGNATWDNAATAKPLKDIRTGVEALTDIGVVATYALMNSKTFDYLLENSQMKNALITTSGVNVDFMTKDKLKELFRSMTGLIPVLYDKKYKDYDGTTKKFYPDDYVTIIGDGELGNTWFGVTPEERTLREDSNVDVSVMDNGIAVAVQTVYGPPVQYNTTASMIALPSFEGMDEIYVIKVK
jgi:hypothetical protein